MVKENDPRVSELQNLAWGLNSLSTKPGCRLSEPSKRNSYKLTSRAIALCTDAQYTEEDDFVKRAADFRKQIEAKRRELEQEEKDTIEELQDKCYVAGASGGGGTYTVGPRRDASAAATREKEDVPNLLTTTVAQQGEPGAPALTVQEVVRSCAAAPSTLSLSNKSLRDSDMEALCRGLQSAGAELVGLDLSGNAIADAGVQRLVTALAGKACPKLADLWLGGNCFGALGEQMLQAGLGALRRGLRVHLKVTLEHDVGSADAEAGGEEIAAEAGSAGAAKTQRSSTGSSAAVVLAASIGAISVSQEACIAQQGGSSGNVSGASSTSASLVEVLDGGAAIRATIALPDSVASVRDLDLDVSAERLVVRTTSGVCLLDAELPHRINPETAQASFSKKRRSLTVSMRSVAGCVK